MFDDFIIWIAALPRIAIVMIVGAVIGGIGGVLGVWLSRFWPGFARILPIACIAGAYPVTVNLVLPYLSHLAFTAGFSKGVGKVPRQIDRVTVLKSAGVYDDAMNFNYRLDTPITDPTQTKDAIKKMLASSSDCRQITLGVEKNFVQRAVFHYETNLGKISVTLLPSDCQ